MVGKDAGVFMADTARGTVVCLKCRERCSSIPMERFKVFWCANVLCSNRSEARVYPDGSFKVLPPGRIYRDAAVRKALAELVPERPG